MNPNELLQKGLGVANGVAGQAQRLVGPARGVYTRVRSATRRDLPDVTVTRKVESIVFRDPRFPKDKVVVNTVDGVVFLRGTLKHAADIKALEAAVRRVPEVRDVENLVTQPKTPKKAPTGRFKKAGEKPVRRGNVTDDRTDDIVEKKEPSPKAKAARREGRSPAPLGAKGEGGPSEAAKADESAGGPDGPGSLPTPTV
jgi:hypothetical protein